MNKIIMIAILILGLSACKPDTIIKREIVKVPVLVFKDPPKPADVLFDVNDLPIAKLTAESTDQEIAKAFTDTTAILISVAKEYKASIEPFKDTTDVE